MNHENKQIVVALVLASIILLVSFFTSSYYKSSEFSFLKENSAGQLVLDNDESSAFLQKDVDGDGLKYWEEALWGTDINKADTDGDGTNDKEETRAGRSPLIPGPNDKIEKIEASKISTIKGTATSTDNTLTDTIARNLYSNYAVLKQSGKLTPENQEKISQSLSLSVGQVLEPKEYTKSSIKVATTENKDSIRKYGNDSMGAIGNSFVGDSAAINEVISLTKYLNNKDQAEMEKLVTSSNSYKKAVQALLLIEVPPSAINIHLGLVNGVNHFASAIEGMTKVDKDPLVALVSLNNYQKGAVEIANSLGEMSKYFKASGVVFKSDEVGYIFTRGI